jgi:hypothetical protein
MTGVGSFYGANVARPYLVLDRDGGAVAGRVDAPRLNDALVAWAATRPFEAGGSLLRPRAWAGPTAGRARTELAIFEEERRADVLAATPALAGAYTPREFRAAASAFWRRALTDEERRSYRARAAGERAAVNAARARLEAEEPGYAAAAEAAAKYRAAKAALAAGARLSSAPLWRAQQAVDARRRAEAGEEGGGAAAGSRPAGGRRKALIKADRRPRPPPARPHSRAKRARLAVARAAEEAEASESEEEAAASSEEEEGGEEAPAAASPARCRAAATVPPASLRRAPRGGT